MAAPASRRQPLRRVVATLGMAALVAAPVVATGGPVEAASLLQPVSVMVAVDGGQAFTSRPTAVAFTVTNRATNGASLAAFTLVVPKGIGAVQLGGVTGSGNWREARASCGSVKACSSLVLVYATLPLTQSVLLPGQSVTVSIMFTTPSTAGPLVFGVIGIGGGLFTTTDKPTVNVVTGAAASFAVSAPASVGAGKTAHLTVQALDTTMAAVPYAGGQVRIQLGADDTQSPQTPLAGASITPTLPTAGATAPFSGSPSSVVLTLPPSASGTYSFDAIFHIAQQQSVTVTETKPLPDATGTAALVVVPGDLVSITYDSVADSSSTPALLHPTQNKSFVSSFHVADAFGNFGSTAPADVSLSATGSGTLTPVSATGASPTQDGTITATYSLPAVSVTLTVTLLTVLPTNPTSSLSTPIDADATSALFVPGPTGAGTLATSNFNPPNPDGSSTCDLTAVTPVCGQTNLPNGANGQVSIAEQFCTGIDTSNGLCAGPSGGAPIVLSVTGNFKDPLGQPLYSNASPASEVLTCKVTVCPHRADDSPQYVYYNDEERVEDFRDFPLYIQLTQTEGFVLVPPCQAVPTNEFSTLLPPDPASPIPPGESACVDVSKTVRNITPGSPNRGDVSFTVLFVDDPKSHP
jgi:hypothetical protein